jgi:hypothetical protein
MQFECSITKVAHARRVLLKTVIVVGALTGAACQESTGRILGVHRGAAFASAVRRADGVTHKTSLAVRMQRWGVDGSSAVDESRAELVGSMSRGQERARGKVRIGGTESDFNLPIVRAGGRLAEKTVATSDSNGTKWELITETSDGGRHLRTEVRRQGEVVAEFSATFSTSVGGVLLAASQQYFEGGRKIVAVDYRVENIEEISEFPPSLTTRLSNARGLNVASGVSNLEDSDGGSWTCFWRALSFLMKAAAAGGSCGITLAGGTVVTAGACVLATGSAIDGYVDWLNECAPKAE